MIPIFNTRKIQSQLRSQRRRAKKRVEQNQKSDRNRALFLAWASKIQPLTFKPDPATRTVRDEWGWEFEFEDNQRGGVGAPSSVAPVQVFRIYLPNPGTAPQPPGTAPQPPGTAPSPYPVAVPKPRQRGLADCYEIPHMTQMYKGELAEHLGLDEFYGLNRAMFDALVVSEANRHNIPRLGQGHRHKVLEAFDWAASGAFNNPWTKLIKQYQKAPIPDWQWQEILEMGADMYGLVEEEDGESPMPWHHSIDLWLRRYWLTPYEAKQFQNIMVPCDQEDADEQGTFIQTVMRLEGAIDFEPDSTEQQIKDLQKEESWADWTQDQEWSVQQDPSGSTNRTPRPLKRRIIKDAEKIFRRRYASKCGELSPLRGNPLYTGKGGMCPYWALAVVKAAAKHGKRLVLQAGSMQWRIVPPQLDDGVSANAFAYMWSPNEPVSRRAIQMGALPEVHVWAADPATQEIIDLSTRDFKRLAENQFGLKWGTKDPPRVLWVNQQEYMAMPDPTYRADSQATMFVLSLLRKKGLL